MTTDPPSQPAQPAPAGRQPTDDPRSARLEIWIACLLGVVAILTAFATYKAVLEDGDTLAKFNEGIRSTNAASQKELEGNQQYTSDQAIYLEFVRAQQEGDEDLAAYFRETLFTPELEEGFKWVEEGPEDAVSPFQAEPESPYVVPFYEEAEKLRAETNAAFASARKHDEDGDKYVLATVVLALALFLLGIAGVGRRYRVQLGLTALASVVTVIGLVQVLSVGL